MPHEMEIPCDEDEEPPSTGDESRVRFQLPADSVEGDTHALERSRVLKEMIATETVSVLVQSRLCSAEVPVAEE
jgi:hypothetical protein